MLLPGTVGPVTLGSWNGGSPEVLVAQSSNPLGDQATTLSRVAAYDPGTGEEIPGRIPEFVAYSPDGTRAAAGGIWGGMGIVDATIPEPLGGAHRDVDLMAERVREHIVGQLERLEQLPLEDLLAKRYQRLMSYGN